MSEEKLNAFEKKTMDLQQELDTLRQTAKSGAALPSATVPPASPGGGLAPPPLPGGLAPPPLPAAVRRRPRFAGGGGSPAAAVVVLGGGGGHCVLYLYFILRNILTVKLYLHAVSATILKFANYRLLQISSITKRTYSKFSNFFT